MLENSPLQKKKNAISKQKLVFGILLALFVIAYNFIWLNRSFTMSEGWVATYVNLINQGKVPYRDFYYFLPPLNLLIDYVIWTISSGYFFVYRLIRLAERVLMVELMYHLISKKVEPFIACVGSFLGAVLASACGYDLVGDYNQTMQLLVVLLCIIVIKYVENIDNLKVKWKWMFLAGVCGGLMFLSKQTIIVSSGITFALFVLYLVITKKEKNFIKMIISVVCGLAVPLGITFAYMVYTHSLTEFIYQVFQDTSSKGSLVSIILFSQTGMIWNFVREVIAILCVAVFFVLQTKKNDSTKKSVSMLQLGLVVGAAVLIGSVYYDDVLTSFKLSFETRFTYVFIVFVALLLIVNINKLYGKLIAFGVGICSILLLLFNVNECAKVLYSDTKSFDVMGSLVTFIHLTLAIYVIFYLIKCKKNKTAVDYPLVILICGSLASGWATSMSSGVNSLTTASAFISVPTLTFVLFRNTRFSKDIYKKLFLVFALACICVCGAQKSQNAYAWWGDSEAPFIEKTLTSDIRALKGFKFSRQEKAKYDGLTELIDYYTDEDSVIFGFPYTKVYNVFLNNYNADTFVPVIFYDVCADDFAEKDAKTLRDNPPDIVVWQDIPDCVELHEEYFRDGEAVGQRKIQKWFYDVYKTDYDLVGQVDCVFVYKLKDGKEPDKTYIERKSRKNTTLEKKVVRKNKPSKTLKGEGTMSKPYLITSADDLKLFKTLVNSGEKFENEYVMQTADIDLSVFETWSPIGIYNSPGIFCGVYNGNGYTIKNLTLSGEEKNGYLGLFGQLAGTVINVTLLDCDIDGNYVGGIASYATYESKIINCAVTGGKINAENRAGGICDNSKGDVVNCICTAKVTGDVPSGISGYFYTNAENCFSTTGNDVSVDDGKPIDEATVDSLNEYLKTIQEKAFRKLLLEWKNDNGTPVLVPESK